MELKMAKTKTVKLKPFEKMLNVMLTGKPVSKEEFDVLLGKEIQMYRISTYVWHIKTIANCTVKVIKDGRKVSSYQLMDVDKARTYLETNGVLLGQPKVEFLGELNAQPEVKQVENIEKVAVAKVDELEITEITD
jgi:hypothetical protein